MKTNMHFGASPLLFRIAKKLRDNPTRAEEALWEQLRKHQLNYKFRRQHPLYKFVVDFYCHFLKFVIEIDGGIHEEEELQLSDLERETIIQSLGLHIIRFSNEEVLFDMDNVIARINAKIEEIKYKH